MTGALQGDWRVEVSVGFVGRLRDILGDHQGDLFGGLVTGRLKALVSCPTIGLTLLRLLLGGREAPETYLWVDLSATRFEDGAAQAFTNRTPRGALHEYAIAGVLHLDHLANLRQSPASAAAIKRQAFLLSRLPGLEEQDTQRKLEDMLRRHEEEWREFVDSLGPHSFVAQWVARGH